MVDLKRALEMWRAKDATVHDEPLPCLNGPKVSSFKLVGTELGRNSGARIQHASDGTFHISTMNACGVPIEYKLGTVPSLSAEGSSAQRLKELLTYCTWNNNTYALLIL